MYLNFKLPLVQEKFKLPLVQEKLPDPDKEVSAISGHDCRY